MDKNFIQENGETCDFSDIFSNLHLRESYYSYFMTKTRWSDMKTISPRIIAKQQAKRTVRDDSQLREILRILRRYLSLSRHGHALR